MDAGRILAFLLLVRVFLRRRGRHDPRKFREFWVHPIYQRRRGKNVGEFHSFFQLLNITSAVTLARAVVSCHTMGAKL